MQFLSNSWDIFYLRRIIEISLLWFSLSSDVIESLIAAESPPPLLLQLAAALQGFIAGRDALFSSGIFLRYFQDISTNISGLGQLSGVIFLWPCWRGFSVAFSLP